MADQPLDSSKIRSIVGRRSLYWDQKVKRRFKYEAELDQGFAERVAKLAYGEKLYSCIQCGTCSASCPVSHWMDFTPRRVIALIQAGYKEEVLECFTIWLCASCYACTVDCPKQIKITDVMYALRQEALEHAGYRKRFPIPVLAREFFKQVLKNGRNSESHLMLNLYMKTNPFKLLKMVKVGLGLLRTGRFSLKKEHIKQREQFQNLLKAVDRLEKEARIEEANERTAKRIASETVGRLEKEAHQ
jgi:quinone-modifying oxidoreductase subunit QmoC